MKNFKELPSRAINGGIQYIAKYPNNYGASIIQHSFSYEENKRLWELAVIKYEPNETNIHNFNLDYTTPITNNVIGYLTESDVNELLDKIEELT